MLHGDKWQPAALDILSGNGVMLIPNCPRTLCHEYTAVDQGACNADVRSLQVRMSRRWKSKF
jgi:hypothetical protein